MIGTRTEPRWAFSDAAEPPLTARRRPVVVDPRGGVGWASLFRARGQNVWAATVVGLAWWGVPRAQFHSNFLFPLFLLIGRSINKRWPGLGFRRAPASSLARPHGVRSVALNCFSSFTISPSFVPSTSFFDLVRAPGGAVGWCGFGNGSSGCPRADIGTGTSFSKAPRAVLTPVTRVRW